MKLFIKRAIESPLIVKTQQKKVDSMNNELCNSENRNFLINKVCIAIKTLHQEIICIAWTVDGDKPCVVKRTSQSSEKKLLEKFFKRIYQQTQPARHIIWIGHHTRSILRILFQRAVIFQIVPTVKLPFANTHLLATVYDTAVLWSGTTRAITLNELCQQLGIARHTAVKRYEENQAIHAKQLIKKTDLTVITQACLDDLKCNSRIFKRLMFNKHYLRQLEKN